MKLQRTNLLGPVGDNKTGFCSPQALTLEKKIFKDLAMILGFLPKFDLEMKIKVKYHD
jgi:hypothetical protein